MSFKDSFSTLFRVGVVETELDATDDGFRFLFQYPLSGRCR